MYKLIVCGLLYCLVHVHSPLVKAETGVYSSKSLLSVPGEAKILLEPDTVSLFFGIEAESETAQIAQKEANQKMHKFIKQLKVKGIKSSEIQTKQILLSPIKESSLSTGYQALQKIEIKIKGKKRFTLISEAIDLALDENLNYISSISFSLSPELILENKSKLYTIATQNALKTGEQVLQDLQLKSTQIKEINLQPSSSFVPYRSLYKKRSGSGTSPKQSNSASIETGKLEIQARVQVILEFIN